MSEKTGLGYWARRVLAECDKVVHDFDPDSVHDLRVALRRCRSMSDGFILIDPDPGWRKLKKLGKGVFNRLGELRDVQVMAEWVGRLGASDDPVSKGLLESLSTKEQQLKQDAKEALLGFDRKQWESLSLTLAEHAQRVPVEGTVFQHLALERWNDAYQLHHRALRNRSQVAFHQLRIGIKKFRYTVENFLAQRHERWGKDLRELQDLLGEVHDLDVLGAILRGSSAVDREESQLWVAKIRGEREQRLAKYRQKTVGPQTLWSVWRAELPQGDTLERAALERLRTWASFLDPDREHSQLVSQLALQLYDGLIRERILHAGEKTRRILEVAALLHDVGRAKVKRGHHKESCRLIRRLVPPLGWSPQDLRAVAAVARYHSGALPHSGHKCLAQLPVSMRSLAIRLAGILRLANAFDLSHEQKVRQLHVGRRNGTLMVRGEGYDELGPTAERLAAARYLLEINCQMPILVCSWTDSDKRIIATS
jgi:exopolyphosphatase/guanosine-5'-triphosphate,3'-diphosphate pyrophosphatase